MTHIIESVSGTGFRKSFDAAFIQSRVEKMASGCWEFISSTRSRGQHVLVHFGTPTNVLAHRLSYQIFKGPIPDGLLICHHCDNPPCVNPDHLYAGTHRDNLMDALNRGRRSPIQAPRGEAGMSNYNDKLVRQAREMYASTDLTLTEVGAALGGVSRATVRKWVDGSLRIEAGGPISTITPRGQHAGTKRAAA